MKKSFYQSKVQTDGIAAHQSIDRQSYTTSAQVLQAIDVYSDNYGLCGKIDLFDKKKSLLIERKKKIKIIYDGYIFQLYAQYHCLTEMGFTVKTMKFYSLSDNKNYPVLSPSENPKMQVRFEKLIKQIHAYRLDGDFAPNANKCQKCIYNSLCDVSLANEND